MVVVQRMFFTPPQPNEQWKNKMKKIRDILEQHREKGRFKPIKPHNVPNVAVVSPRPSSDSADVKLKGDLRRWFSKTDPQEIGRAHV